MLGSRPSTSAITDRPLANRWVRAPGRSAVPLLALGQVHLAHNLAILNQDTKHVRVALFAVAACASHSYPALPFMEARREARASVLLISRCVGECVQARAVGVDPVEV
jgi:hypothetical protein